MMGPPSSSTPTRRVRPRPGALQPKGRVLAARASRPGQGIEGASKYSGLRAQFCHDRPPPRLAISELLQAVASTDSCAKLLSLDDRLVLRLATFCTASGKAAGGMDDAERVALFYSVVLAASSQAAQLDPPTVAAVTALLVTVALSGLATWSTRGWLDELVPADPVVRSSRRARCHASIFEELGTAKLRALRLSRLLVDFEISREQEAKAAVDKAAAELEAAAAAAAAAVAEGEGGGQDGPEGAAAEASKTGEEATPTAEAGEEGATATATGEGEGEGEGESGTEEEEEATDANLFSSVALRHAAVCGLAALHHGAENRASARHAFVANGGVEAALLLGFFGWSDERVETVNTETAAAKGGQVAYNYDLTDYSSTAEGYAEGYGDGLRASFDDGLGGMNSWEGAGGSTSMFETGLAAPPSSEGAEGGTAANDAAVGATQGVTANAMTRSRVATFQTSETTEGGRDERPKDRWQVSAMDRGGVDRGVRVG